MIDLKKIKEIDKIEDFATKVYEAAKYYVGLNIFVVPLRGNNKALLNPAKGGINYSSASRNLKVIDRWFGPNGKYVGCNIGIACGKQGGVFAMDIDNGVDNKGIERNGFESLENILEEMEVELDDIPYQTTPSGGRHYLFQWQTNGRSSTDKMGRGIDTRGGDMVSCRSHIVAWPSTIDVGDRKVGYRWSRGGEIEPLPPWISELLGAGWDGKPTRPAPMPKSEEIEEKELPSFMSNTPVHSGQDLGNENSSTSSDETRYTVRQMANMMKHIDIDEVSYEEWLMVGQAINTQHPTPKGLELWDRWSQQGNRYQQNECQIRWAGFHEDGPIRIGTLIGICAKFGYNPASQGNEVIETPEAVVDMMDEMNREFAVTVIGGSVKVLMECKPNTLDPLADRYKFISRNDFLTMMENKKVFIQDAKGNPKSVNKGLVWLSEERRRTYPAGIVFMPDKEREVEGAYNTWQPWPYKAKNNPVGWQRFYDHLKLIVCSDHSAHFEWLLDWMADIVQNPTKPKGSALVLAGEEGTGKGTVAHVLGALLGQHYKHVTDEDHLIGRFNGHLQDAILIFADEVTYGGSKKTAGKLKALVSEPVLTAERKGIDATRYMNYSRLIVASNESWFIPAGPQSRRWFVLKVSSLQANKSDYFAKIWKEMKAGGYESMMHFLSQKEITSNLRYAPVTEKLKEQRTLLAAQDSVMEWWAYCLELGSIPHLAPNEEWQAGSENENKWPEGYHESIGLFGAYEQWVLEKRVRRQNISGFGISMTSMGIKKERKRSGGGQRKMTFNIPSHKECIIQLETRGGMTTAKEEI